MAYAILFAVCCHFSAALPVRIYPNGTSLYSSSSRSLSLIVNRIASHGLDILAHLEKPIITTVKLKSRSGRSQKNGLKGELT
jgi:hypothetical protein